MTLDRFKEIVNKLADGRTVEFDTNRNAHILMSKHPNEYVYAILAPHGIAAVSSGNLSGSPAYFEATTQAAELCEAYVRLMAPVWRAKLLERYPRTEIYAGDVTVFLDDVSPQSVRVRVTGDSVEVYTHQAYTSAADLRKAIALHDEIVEFLGRK